MTKVAHVFDLCNKLRLQKRERLYGPYKLAVKMNLHYNRANDLTQGSIMGTMLRFAVPMILGNLLQQCYNIADTLIVGHYLGQMHWLP